MTQGWPIGPPGWPMGPPGWPIGPPGWPTGPPGWPMGPPGFPQSIATGPVAGANPEAAGTRNRHRPPGQLTSASAAARVSGTCVSPSVPTGKRPAAGSDIQSRGIRTAAGAVDTDGGGRREGRRARRIIGPEIQRRRRHQAGGADGGLHGKSTGRGACPGRSAQRRSNQCCNRNNSDTHSLAPIHTTQLCWSRRLSSTQSRKSGRGSQPRTKKYVHFLIGAGSYGTRAQPTDRRRSRESGSQQPPAALRAP
jgi:hypothetical protein